MRRARGATEKTLAEKVRDLFEAEGAIGPRSVGYLVGMAWGAAIESGVGREEFLEVARRISQVTDAEMSTIGRALGWARDGQRN